MPSTRGAAEDREEQGRQEHGARSEENQRYSDEEDANTLGLAKEGFSEGVEELQREAVHSERKTTTNRPHEPAEELFCCIFITKVVVLS